MEAILIVRVKNESILECCGTDGTPLGLSSFTGFEKRGDGMTRCLGKWENPCSREGHMTSSDHTIKSSLEVRGHDAKVRPLAWLFVIVQYHLLQ